MKKYPIWLAYSLIGIGLFTLFRSHLTLLSDISTLSALFMIIGLACLLDSLLANNPQYLLIGTILLGVGIHFHGIGTFSFWPNHWSVYLLIIGIALIVRSFKTKQGLLFGLIVIIVSNVIMISYIFPQQFGWLDQVIAKLEMLWPFILIIIGIYMLTKKS